MTHDFYSALVGEEISVEIQGLTLAKRISGINKISLDIVNGDYFSKPAMLLYSFVLKAEKVCTPVTITIGSTQMTYYVPVQWTRYYMPIETAKLECVTIAGDVLLAEAKFVNYQDASMESMALLSGPWLLEDFMDMALGENGVATGGTKDMVKSGNFVYSIGSGNFVVTDVTDPSGPQVRGKISGLGMAIRQMDLLPSGVDVFVTSRQNGAFIINISDPDRPYVRSRYDSIEMATGMCLYQNFAFVCNRQYGVEMVDISDLDNPKHIVNIFTNGTVQSCMVLEGILYCGQWNECCVSMYDVTNPDVPKYMNEVPLKGKGDGMAVSRVDGRVYLYAASGQHHSKKITNTCHQSKLEFGQGNGLEIFDITDIYNPVWLSTTNIDGRYYYASEDCWDVKVSVDPQGNRYAYYMDTYNGVYIFNVNDPSAPVRLAHITVRIPATSEKYFTLSHPGRDTILPYDQSQYAQDAIASIYVEKGVLYLAGNRTGIHIWRNDDFLYDVEEHDVTVPIMQSNGSLYDFDGSSYEGFFRYTSGTQFYAVAVGEGKVYAAAGSAGVLVFDQQTMKLETILQTKGAAMDIVYYGGRLYVAERTAGLGVYTVEANGSFTEYLRYTDGQNTIRGVRLSPKARFAVVQVAASVSHVVNIENPAALTMVYKGHAATHLYHRNLGRVGRYVVAWACSGNEFWYDFGENDDYPEPVMIRKVKSSATHMRGGIVAYGKDKVISVHNNGYRVYDPMDTSAEPRSYTHHILDGIKMAGKPCNYKDQLLILSNRIDRVLQVVDIRDVENPKMLASIDVTGNPDQAVADGDWLYVPMAYQGLFRFHISSFLPI